MAVWFISEFIFAFLVHLLLPKIPKYALSGKVKLFGTKFLATIPAFLRGLIFVALFLVLTATFPIQPTIKQAVQDSKLGSLILKYAYNLEQPLKQVFGGVTKDTLTFLTIEPKTNERVDLGFQTGKYFVDPVNEEAMIVLVNKERTNLGIAPLTLDAKLQGIARFHSEDMFKRGYFSHYSPEGETVADRAERFSVSFSIIGENLAFAPSLDLAHDGLMKSPGHRANILSTDFRKIGIGIMDGGIYGKMFTQVFSD